jgi:hypothetical protein
MFEGWIKANGLLAKWWPCEHGNTWISVENANGYNKQKVYVVSQTQLREKLADAARSLPSGGDAVPTIMQIQGGK